MEKNRIMSLLPYCFYVQYAKKQDGTWSLFSCLLWNIFWFWRFWKCFQNLQVKLHLLLLYYLNISLSRHSVRNVISCVIGTSAIRLKCALSFERMSENSPPTLKCHQIWLYPELNMITGVVKIEDVGSRHFVSY